MEHYVKLSEVEPAMKKAEAAMMSEIEELRTENAELEDSINDFHGAFILALSAFEEDCGSPEPKVMKRGLSVLRKVVGLE